MEFFPVKSAVMKGYGYDPASSDLTIYWHGDRVTRYIGVPLRVFEGFLVAESKGKFVNQRIKGVYSEQTEV